jgi:maltose alpha-D-glucosyltransferase/alpha-amylase
MQWSSDHYGGFSSSKKIVVPIVDDRDHGFRKVNVADQRRDPMSLLNWTERRIRARKDLLEIGWGECAVVETDTPHVLVLRYAWRNTALVTVHNFADREQIVQFDIKRDDGGLLWDYFDEDNSEADASGRHRLTLPPYGHKWYRVGGPDTAVKRSTLL